MLKKLLTTTILTSAITCGAMAYAQTTPIVTTETSTITKTINPETIADTRMNAEHFLEHINAARVSIAINDILAAQAHLSSARELIVMLKNVKVEERKIVRVESGRVVYDYKTALQDHYFPIEKVQTGPVDVTTTKKGPFWATSQTIAVTDAETVYLTLDLSDEKAEKGLEDAWKHLEEKDLKAAQQSLETLIKEVVSIDSSVSRPIDKAIDNIILTQNFITAKNYEGARYALSHADDALSSMEGKSKYASQKKTLKSLRKEVSALQLTLKQKDPTTLQKADAQLNKLWKDLKNWADKTA